MSFANAVFVSAFAATLLLGCKKAEAPPAPKLDSSSSVAAPNASMPPSDATITPSPPSGTHPNGDANGPTQATPKELSKDQESSAMPLSGQVNNHSTANTTSEKK